MFKTIDRRHLAVVLSKFQSHGGLDIYEAGLGFSSVAQGASNKDQRATAIIRHIFDQPDTDQLVLDMLDYLFVTPTHSDRLLEDEDYKVLEQKVLIPRGIVLTDDGYKSSGAPMAQAAPSPSPTVTSSPTPAPGNRSVFVVHGRDDRPVKVVDQFLTFCGLEMMTWSDAVRATGKPQPTTYDIVLAGITNAAAIVVIFSPDDLGRVKDAYANSDHDPDKKPQGQARQNVILEAGMAFGIAPDRTIFIQSEPTRSLSDIDGFNWVKLNGEYDSRADLIGRLPSAKAPVRHKPNLVDHTAGPFKVI
ncbi:TIR domain-containing protein [Curtobacterium sp. MCBD17_003]|uniref:TIR domain-containing protein n=1 Tax=Curtobacterium sp. MCBD17_003 TaxID=2175667 RepID=UPI0015E8B518|nr:TIR domain-containing protein [Curtobacterium sp. MCBD17_003]WIE53973.1 nucleotide-binding protein [Curtobacterium sp. MCBD17_003]